MYILVYDTCEYDAYSDEYPMLDRCSQSRECSPYTSGERCENWRCINGGIEVLPPASIPFYDRSCLCPVGRIGPHCESGRYLHNSIQNQKIINV